MAGMCRLWTLWRRWRPGSGFPRGRPAAMSSRRRCLGGVRCRRAGWRPRSSSSTVTPPRICRGLRHLSCRDSRPAQCATARKECCMNSSRRSRPGVLSPAKEGRDDRLADRGVTRPAQACGLPVPEEWCSRTKGIPRHAGAPVSGTAAGSDRRGRGGRGAVLQPGPFGPQVRLPGAADRGVRLEALVTPPGPAGSAPPRASERRHLHRQSAGPTDRGLPVPHQRPRTPSPR
jgi:hypothetical protein